jgi:hypothetical protein
LLKPELPGRRLTAGGERRSTREHDENGRRHSRGIGYQSFLHWHPIPGSFKQIGSIRTMPRHRVFMQTDARWQGATLRER